MTIQKWLNTIVFLLLFMTRHLLCQIIVEGVVKDTGSEPVKNALVELIDQNNSNRIFSCNTDSAGEFVIKIPTDNKVAEQAPKDFYLFQNYPNPFNSQTVIRWDVSKPAHMRIDIYNILGQKITTLYSGFYAHRSGQIVWDALDDFGRSVATGIYICSFITNEFRMRNL